MKSFLSLFRGSDEKNYVVSFALVNTLFFLWDFCNGIINVLNRHFQNSLSISKTESAWVQGSTFLGYFFMAIPSGLLARRFGNKGGILIGLALIPIGALWFIPATISVHLARFYSAFSSWLDYLADTFPCGPVSSCRCFVLYASWAMPPSGQLWNQRTGHIPFIPNVGRICSSQRNLPGHHVFLFEN